MGDSTDRQREEQAFDKLIASQLRRKRNLLDLTDLPELTKEELEIMNSVPDDIIERLWEAEASCPDEPESNEEHENEDDCTLAGAGDESYRGFFRAPDMVEEDQTKLDESRKEVLDELKKAKRNKKGEDAK